MHIIIELFDLDNCVVSVDQVGVYFLNMCTELLKLLASDDLCQTSLSFLFISLVFGLT